MRLRRRSPRRRPLLPAVALLAVLALSGCGVIASGSTPEPVARKTEVSWASGAGTADPAAFATWRNRPVSVWTTWNDASTWSDMRQLWTVDQFTGPTRFAGRMSFGQPLLDKTSTYAGCTAGSYDADFRAIATGLVTRGFGDAFVRLGWEMNSGDYRWKVGTNYAGFIGCFTRAAKIFKAASPAFVVEWNPAATATATRIDLTYPGDDVVDQVGADYYDGWPAADTAAAFDAKCQATDGDSPVGLCRLADFARAHHKKLSVPEWGIRNQAASGSGDNALFVRGMFDFFVRNRDILAYEAYFDLEGPRFELSHGANPRAAATYRALWSA